MSKSSNNLQNIENPEITPPSTPLGNRLLNLSGTSKRNNYLLENKFKKLFENSMNELQITEKLDFNQIHQVLTSFGIIQSLPNKSDVNNKLITELWKTLNGDQQDGILRSNFYLFLLIVLRLNFPSKPYNTNIRNETNTFIGNFDEKGKWVIGFSEDVKKLQKKFEIFYLNKLSNDNNSKKKETSSNKDSKQHRPSISPISKVLAEHHREKLLNEILFLTHNGQTLEGLDLKLSENKILNNIDLMVIQKKIQTLHHHFLQEEKKNKERKQCTFTPAFKKAGGRSRVNSVTTAHNYNTKNKIKINKDPLQIEFEKYKKECTFKPEILKKNTICNSNKTKIIPFIRNEKKTIERIRKAQKEKEFMESCRQRGAHSSHLSRRKCETNTLNTTTCINSLYEQKEIMEEKKQENMPLLFVDVNLGENKSERIVIYKGDKTEELAKKFCNYHSKF